MNVADRAALIVSLLALPVRAEPHFSPSTSPLRIVVLTVGALLAGALPTLLARVLRLRWSTRTRAVLAVVFVLAYLIFVAPVVAAVWNIAAAGRTM
jgi:hypothetical protein